MRLSICPQPLFRLGLERALEWIAGQGIGALELPVDTGGPHADLDRLLAGEAAHLRRQTAAFGLELSALSNHREGQLGRREFGRKDAGGSGLLLEFHAADPCSARAASRAWATSGRLGDE